MRRRLLDILACPACGGVFVLRDGATWDGGDAVTGDLDCTGCSASFPIVRSVPRLADSGYTESFGKQWNLFRQTQVDMHNGTTISRDRFVDVTGWQPGELAHEWVLDAGCGAGRFAQVALDFGGEVVAMDLSNAVDAAWENLRAHPAAERLHVVQASLYALPFRPGVFDRVYSIGVLQHTPDVGRATKNLPPLVRPGGRIALWVYVSRALNVLEPKYLLRPITTRIAPDTALTVLQRAVPWLMTVSNAVGRVPVAGRYLRRMVPVANYTGVLPLDKKALAEWALLDTFDWLTPAYDQPQTFETLAGWLLDTGCESIARAGGGAITARKA